MRKEIGIYGWAVSFLKPYRWQLAFVIAASFAITFGELSIPKFVQHVIDTIIPGKDGAGLFRVLLFIGGIVVLNAALGAVKNLVQRRLIEKASKDTQDVAFEQLREMGFAYFERTSVGEILTTMNTQVQALQKIYRQFLPAMIRELIFAGLSLVMMAVCSWQLALFVIPSFLLYYLFGPWLEKKASMHARSFHEANRGMQRKTYESLASMAEVRAFGREDWDMGRLQETQKPAVFHYVQWILYANLRGSNRRLTYFAGAIGIFLWGAGMIQDGTLSTGQFVAFLLYYFSGMHGLTSLVTMVTEQRLLVYQIEPLYEFLQERADVAEPKHGVLPSDVRGEIVFEDVHFGYPKRDAVLNGFQLQIRAGEKVALVGVSGGGKSTLLKLIGRFYDPLQGRITLDGVPLGELTFAQLRGGVGYVFQETYLFGDTVMENIRFGNPDATDDEVVEAAKLAYCHDFIMQLEQGYLTKVGERGFKLSGGQKQRIAIARMLIKNPAIVLLDEATSALDNVSEREVQAALDRLLAGRTVVAVAHRLSTIRDYDKIVVLEQGRNVEEGTWMDLMERKGHFYQLASGMSEADEKVPV